MPLDPVDLLVRLIKCKSVTPNEGGALSIIEDVLRPNHFKCERLNFGKGKERVENLFARFGDNGPHICFAGHTDVVPEGDGSSWLHPPFGGNIHEGKVFGRGAVDMKGSIASYIGSVIKWLKVNPGFKGSLSFLITGDEEGPAVNGTIKVLNWMEENNQIPDMCLVGEPTNKSVSYTHLTLPTICSV